VNLTMTDILDLQGWTVIDKRMSVGEYEIEAEYTVQPHACIKCGVISNLYKHGTKPIVYRDSPIRGHHVRIIANVQRYKCRECGGTFIQPLGGIHDDMRMTARCVEYIQSQCMRDTFLRIADHVGCDDKTIRNVAGNYINQLNAEYHPWLPEWLGIDETQIDGSLRCILTDVGNRVPIDMLPNRDKGTVINWLHHFRNRGVVKGLAMDMWKPYKDAARIVFPNLPIIIDKFHVVRMANTAMDDIRIQLAKEQPKAVGKDWMRRKSLLRLRHKKLDEKGRFSVDMWLDNEPDVATAYWLKEAFYDIYDANNKVDAAALLDAWRESIPANMKKGKKSFAPLLTAAKNWREEILAYFDYPISNGYTEALNGVAKVVNRQGRGYSFEVLRARVLFGRKPKKIDKEVEINKRCDSCLGLFAETYEQQLGRKVYNICASCRDRFHTQGDI
jgi:transposase